MKKPTSIITNLSIVILTNKQDQLFINALESAQVAEKILLVDNHGYHWQTLQKKYRFQVHQHLKPINNFAKVRNQALKLITTKWVMFLDSDETLGKDRLLKQNIKAINKALQQSATTVYVKRKDIFLKRQLKHGEVGNVKLIRLFQTKKANFSGNIHEVVNSNEKQYQSEVTLLHYAHPSITQFLASISDYSKLASNNETASLLLLVKMIIYPLAKFITNYFFKLGFLDGYRGLTYATLMSLHSFFVRIYRYEDKK